MCGIVASDADLYIVSVLIEGLQTVTIFFLDSVGVRVAIQKELKCQPSACFSAS